jgi:hypothetical protein
MYTPQTWEKTYNPDTGLYRYTDPRLNEVQTNLVTLNRLLARLREGALIDLQEIQRNLEAKTIKKPSVDGVGALISTMISFLGLAFPEGKAGEACAILFTDLLTNIVQQTTSDNIDNPDYQAAVNELRDSIETWFNSLIDQISKMIHDMEGLWTKTYQDGKIRLCDVADRDEYLPHPDVDQDYNDWYIASSALIKREMTKALLPVKYRRQMFSIENHDASPCWFWAVQWVEVSGSDAWDEWRSLDTWPKIPPWMKGYDLEGPHEDIGNWDDIKGGHQYYQSFDIGGGCVWNAARWDERQYWWTRTSDQRWMSPGGRWCASNDAKEQGNTCDWIVKDGQVIRGTPFLDFVDDVRSGAGGFTICQDSGDSVLLCYELRDPVTREIVRNTRREDLLTSVDGCKDYVYLVNWFRWNWCYIGIQLRFYKIVDEHGNAINNDTAKWLLYDDGHGKVTNPHGIANRLDVYFNWGLEDL